MHFNLQDIDNIEGKKEEQTDILIPILRELFENNHRDFERLFSDIRENIIIRTGS